MPLEDPEETLPRGKLTFELRGYKLRGAWHLFRTTRKKGEKATKEWMLVKRTDGWASESRALPQESIYSGLTLEEIRSGSQRAAAVRAELEALGAPRREVRAADVKLMLAETGERPFTDPEWLFELKYDGYRVLAEREGGDARLRYRRGSDATSLYPDVARALRALPFGDLVLDGELVVLDEESRPSFQRLQRRAQQRRTIDIQRATLELPATLYVFDLLAFEGFDVRPLPLVERKRLVRQLLPAAGPIRFLDHIPEQGEAFYAEVSRLRLEGLIAKRADSAYHAGRSPHWLKLRAERTDDFVVVGFTEPQGGRTGFGALHLAGLEGRRARLLRARRERLRRGAAGGAARPPRGRPPGHAGLLGPDPHRARPRLGRAPPRGRGALPGLDRGRPAAPAGLPAAARRQARRGVPPAGPRGGRCGPGDGGTSEAAPRDDPPAPGVSELMAEPPVEKKVPFTNLTKVFWPEEGYTKGDLIDYYRAISPWLLPYLKDRPLVMTRYPDGIAGKSFFQKDAPSFSPGWVRLERVWSESAEREIDYFVADDVETLLYIANLGTILLHVWASRVQTLARPDWCILDLDPKTAPFAHVVEVARAIHDLAEEIALPTFVKTSGSTGLHVLIPLGGLCTFEQCKQLGELLARVVAGRLPDIATTVRLPGRPGRPRLPGLPPERARQAPGRPLHRAPGPRGPGLRARSGGTRSTTPSTWRTTRSRPCPSAWRCSPTTPSRPCSPRSPTW